MRFNPNQSLDHLEDVLQMLFDAFCAFSASFAHHFADTARYAAQNDEPNLLENPSKIMSSSNDGIGLKTAAILMLFICFAAPSLMAQRLGGGVFLGPTLTTMKMSSNDTASFRVGFCGGVRIALIPEHSIIGGEIDIIYSRQGMSTKMGHDATGQRTSLGMKSSYINVPILMTFYLRKWNEEDESEKNMVRLRVGPQFGFCLGGSDLQTVKGKNQSTINITPWKKGTYNWLDYGVTAAVSYWFVEVRYFCGFGKIFKGDDASFNHVISLTFSDIW